MDLEVEPVRRLHTFPFSEQYNEELEFTDGAVFQKVK